IVLADDIDDAALGLGSGCPEERTAVAARDVDGVDEINRREQALITCTAHVLAELLALLRRDVRIRIDVVFRECLPAEGRRIGRIRLRWPAAFAGHAADGNGPLFDRPDRLARLAIEHIEEAGLA